MRKKNRIKLRYVCHIPGKSTTNFILVSKQQTNNKCIYDANIAALVLLFKTLSLWANKDPKKERKTNYKHFDKINVITLCDQHLIFTSYFFSVIFFFNEL